MKKRLTFMCTLAFMATGAHAEPKPEAEAVTSFGMVTTNSQYYCKPGSAIKYKLKEPGAIMLPARPAPRHGSCKFQ